MLRMLITLNEDERRALTHYAKHERREIRQQAAVMIRHELQRRGLLPAEQPTADDRQSAGSAAVVTKEGSHVNNQ